MRKSSILLLLVLLWVGCEDKQITFKDLPQEGWAQENELIFDSVPLEESEEVQLHIRHTDSYPFQNLWLKVSHQPKGAEPNFERVEFQMAQPDGRWIGKKKGAFQTLTTPLNLGSCSDSCVIIIQQNMRQNPLQGIQAIGLTAD